jgi:hypothetical protein
LYYPLIKYLSRFSVLFLALFSVLPVFLSAQKATSRPAWLVIASTAYQVTGGETQDRFGNSVSIGVGTGYKTQNNWVYSFEGNYAFGTGIKQAPQILDELLGTNGFIFNQAGNYAQLNLFYRSLHGHVSLEKILPIWNVNGNSGPIAGFGAGYLAHWIRLDNVGNDAPQVLDEYQKGYDRLSGGVSLKQSLGYLYFSKSEGINFKLSFEFMQAFTNSYRGFNYDTGLPDTDQRLELFYNIKLNWYLPIYKKATSNYYYN